MDLDVLARKQRSVQGIVRLHRVFDVHKFPLAFNLWPIRRQRHDDAGWRGQEVEFKRRFVVNQVNWTNSLVQIRVFVGEQK